MVMGGREVMAWWLASWLVGGAGGAGTCGAGQQRRILESVPECGVRGDLVDLAKLISLANITRQLGMVGEEVVRVVPDMVSVNRCGGGCHLNSHSCRPTEVQEREVEVMLVLAKWPEGEHSVVCTSLQVEEHFSCSCDCHQQQHHCLPQQIYHPSSCACTCPVSQERGDCLHQGRVWDPSTCSCSCPASSWTYCSTGYMFDSSSSCSCIPVASLASESLLTVTVGLVAAAFVLFVMFMMVRRSRMRRVHGMREKASKRTCLMSQVSYAQYEANEDPGARTRGSRLAYQNERGSLLDPVEEDLGPGAQEVHPLRSSSRNLCRARSLPVSRYEAHS